MSIQQPIVLLTTDLDEQGRQRPYYFVYDDYVAALDSVGLSVLVLPAQNSASISSLVQHAHGVVVPGGDDLICTNKTPEETFVVEQRQTIDVQVVTEALKHDIPLLGICYGMQLINYVLGGEHNRHDHCAHRHMNGAVHPLQCEPDTQGFPEQIWDQPSNHHQSIKVLGKGLKSVIRSDDGLIEGFCSVEKTFVRGFQWHVEKRHTVADTFILGSFAEAVKNYKNRKMAINDV